MDKAGKWVKRGPATAVPPPRYAVDDRMKQKLSAAKCWLRSRTARAASENTSSTRRFCCWPTAALVAGDWQGLAATDSFDATTIDAAERKTIRDRLRAPLRQLPWLYVFAAATIRVAFDQHLRAFVLLQEARDTIEHCTGARLESRLSGVEEHIAQRQHHAAIRLLCLQAPRAGAARLPLPCEQRRAARREPARCAPALEQPLWLIRLHGCAIRGVLDCGPPRPSRPAPSSAAHRLAPGRHAPVERRDTRSAERRPSVRLSARFPPASASCAHLPVPGWQPAANERILRQRSRHRTRAWSSSGDVLRRRGAARQQQCTDESRTATARD